MLQQSEKATKYKKGLPEIWSVDDLQRYYEYSSSGHWFSKDTMRFFKTRLTNHFRRLSPEVFLFVTSEQDWQGKRAASIRYAKFVPADNFAGYKIEIGTIGTFHIWSSPATAATAMKKVVLAEVLD